MMNGMGDAPPAKKKWPRSQKFRLTEKGVASEAAYQEAVVASRAKEGRAAFDAARLAWAQPLKLQPDDALCLSELKAKPATVSEVVKALEDSGGQKDDLIAGVHRLVDAGLVEPLP